MSEELEKKVRDYMDEALIWDTNLPDAPDEELYLRREALIDHIPSLLAQWKQASVQYYYLELNAKGCFMPRILEQALGGANMVTLDTALAQFICADNRIRRFLKYCIPLKMIKSSINVMSRMQEIALAFELNNMIVSPYQEYTKLCCELYAESEKFIALLDQDDYEEPLKYTGNFIHSPAEVESFGDLAFEPNFLHIDKKFNSICPPYKTDKEWNKALKTLLQQYHTTLRWTRQTVRFLLDRQTWKKQRTNSEILFRFKDVLEYEIPDIPTTIMADDTVEMPNMYADFMERKWEREKSK